jgi:hypothetical protein
MENARAGALGLFQTKTLRLDGDLVFEKDRGLGLAAEGLPATR